MTQYTEGPWDFQNRGSLRGESGRVVIVDANQKSLAKLKDLSEVSYANARLIAAAPELLGALEAMLRGADLVMTETLDGGNPFPTLAHAAQKARAAVAKAEA